MNGRTTIRLSSFTLVCLAAGAAVNGFAIGGEPVEFGHEIRPVLSDACFRCHGADASQRQAELRLDQHSSLLADRGGYRAVVPGEPARSELYRRITSDDPDQRMPPAGAVRKPSKSEIESIRRWIEQGAGWQRHWSLVAPRRHELPVVSDADWPIRGMDGFVLARLDKTALRPAAEAERTRLLRRVTLDLTGLPPTLEEIDSFLADDGPDAYASTTIAAKG